MEAISRIGNSLASTPTDRCTLRIIEGLGGELKVVHRNDVSTHATNQGGKHVGSERDLLGSNIGVWGLHENPISSALKFGGLGVFKNLDPKGKTRPLKTPHQASRVHHGRAVWVVDPTKVGRGADPLAELFFRQYLDIVASSISLSCLFDQLIELPGFDRNGQFAGPFKIAVDAITLDGGLNGVEILEAEALKAGNLFWKSSSSIFESVGE